MPCKTYEFQNALFEDGFQPFIQGATLFEVTYNRWQGNMIVRVNAQPEAEELLKDLFTQFIDTGFMSEIVGDNVEFVCDYVDFALLQDVFFKPEPAA